MKKVKNMMNRVIKSSLTLLLLLPFLGISQIPDSLYRDDILKIELQTDDEKSIILSFTNITNDTISVRNSYNINWFEVASYISIYYHDDKLNKYQKKWFKNAEVEPYILLDEMNNVNMIRIPPKTKKFFNLGHWGKYKIFLEIQTIVRYRKRNYFVKIKTNEIIVE
ncbi:hypothetical protein ACI76O_11420 [Capnocytophaga cynodegmi]|uniref:hypothetical protein n=1 Tax=Capnocytophaga cynodegmi TaxID=28189 RepID=UPI00385FB073